VLDRIGLPTLPVTNPVVTPWVPAQPTFVQSAEPVFEREDRDPPVTSWTRCDVPGCGTYPSCVVRSNGLCLWHPDGLDTVEEAQVFGRRQLSGKVHYIGEMIAPCCANLLWCDDNPE
jgi:hypothetical protein